MSIVKPEAGAGSSLPNGPTYTTLLITPNTGTQTIITATLNSTYAIVGYFYYTITTSTPLVPGVWDLNIWANVSGVSDKAGIYFMTYYNTGVPGPTPTGTQLGAGSSTTETQIINTTQAQQYINSVYVSTTTTYSTGYISVYIYAAKISFLLLVL